MAPVTSKVLVSDFKNNNSSVIITVIIIMAINLVKKESKYNLSLNYHLRST